MTPDRYRDFIEEGFYDILDEIKEDHFKMGLTLKPGQHEEMELLLIAMRNIDALKVKINAKIANQKLNIVKMIDKEKRGKL